MLIKRYEGAFFTSDFISRKTKTNISISCAKGNGMALQDKKPGKIIILAGGTGFYPFIDLIDILYKKALCEDNHERK